MTDPKQPTAKVVLNVTTYKPIDGRPDVSLPTSDNIDITDLLRARGIQSLYSINGVTEYEPGAKGEYGDTPAETHFVIVDEEIIGIANDVYRIIDAAIVNSKQAEAIKSLVKDSTEKLIKKCWDRIRG